MNVKTTVILLVLLGACLGYIVVAHTDWFGRPTTETAPAKAADKRLLADFGDVERLALERPGEPTIVLLRRDRTWRLAEPIDAPATAWQADSTVTTLTSMRWVRKAAESDAGSPKDTDTHLSDPLRTATLTNDKGRSVTIKVGRHVPLAEEQTYVQVSGDAHVYVVAQDLLKALSKTVADYREDNVAEFKTDQAVRVAVRGGEAYDLIKVKDRWAVEVPARRLSARADGEKVASLLKAVSGLSATEFVNDAPTAQDLAGYGLTTPALSVTVELAPPTPATAPATASAPAKPKKGKGVTVLFGAAGMDKKLFAKLAEKPWVFKVDAEAIKDIQVKLEDLRDKGVLELAGDEVNRIDIDLAVSGKVAIERTADNGWRMLGPFPGPCESAAVDGLIAAMRDLKAKEFKDNPPSLAGFGLVPPVGRIALRFRGGDQTTVLLLGKATPSGQNGFVMPDGGKSVAVVLSDDYRKLLRPAAAYWPVSLLDLPADAEITRVNLVRADKTKFALLAGDDGTYKLTQPIQAAADTDNATALIDALKSVRADKIIALGNALPKRFAKAKPIRVRVTYRTPVPPASQPATSTSPASQAATSPATQPATKPATSPASKPATKPASAPATKPAKAEYKTHQAEALLVIADKGKSYVWRRGAKPLAVGELPEDFHKKLAAELRDRTCLKIDPDKAVSFSMSIDKDKMEFRRTGEQWKYTKDPTVTVDAKKVKDWLKALSQIKAQRFVDYSPKADPKRFGLDKPLMTIEVKHESERTSRLSISRASVVGEKGHYAAATGAPGVFILAPDAAKNVTKSLKDFKADGKDEDK